VTADFALTYDLTLDEARRRAAVLEAIDDDWDPITALAEERRPTTCCTRTSTPSSSGSTTNWFRPVCCRIGRPAVLPIDPDADAARRATMPELPRRRRLRRLR
jgi:hypothetical protein